MGNSDVQFFDNLAEIWDEMTYIDPVQVRHILDVASIDKGASILDVGTGTGVLIPYLEEIIGPEGHITAVDIAPRMIEVARRKFHDCTNVSFEVSDIENENRTDTFDHIMMFCMYPHLHNGLDTVEWLAKVNLKPGGNLIIAFPESKKAINSIDHHNDGSCHSDKLIEGVEFARVLSERGLNPVYVEDNDNCYIVIVSR